MIALTCIVKNRAWILPDYLACLLALDFPKDELTLIFIDDASTDGTIDILKAFKRKHEVEFAGITLNLHKKGIDDATSARDTADRVKGYPHLAELRNEALDAANASGADYQFSVDSDILLSPGILSELMAHNLPYVASMIFNDGKHPFTANLGRVTNAGGLHNGMWRYMQVNSINQDRVLPCGYSGAVYLVNRDAMNSGARFGGENPDEKHNCEDYSYCWALQIAEIDRYIDTKIRCVHVMMEGHLPAAKGFFFAQFEKWPFGV